MAIIEIKPYPVDIEDYSDGTFYTVDDELFWWSPDKTPTPVAEYSVANPVPSVLALIVQAYLDLIGVGTTLNKTEQGIQAGPHQWDTRPPRPKIRVVTADIIKDFPKISHDLFEAKLQEN